MLIEFNVENYLSFREKRILSMEATGISDYPENVFEAQNGRYKLLKSAVIYGANSSGKSNLLNAFSTMRGLVSARLLRYPRPKSTPHLLYQPTIDLPTKFEVLFILNKTMYRYGFEISHRTIKSEWLYHAEKKSEKNLFLRRDQIIDVSDSFNEGNNLEDKTREDRLFIKIVSEFNGPISRAIVSWFSKTQILLGLNHSRYAQTTIDSINSDNKREQIFKFYNELNLGFNKVIIEQNIETYVDAEDGSEHVEHEEIPKTVHAVFNKEFENTDDTALFDLKAQESDGTNKLFNLSGKLFEALTSGGLLIIDELDSSLHPLIMLNIVKLFNSEKTNPKNAQLIYTTHDTNMLHYGHYRRDQIWFTEKDKYGGTDLYSLVEIKDTRKGADYEEQYIKGRYGAIPYIGNIEKLFEEWHNPEK